MKTGGLGFFCWPGLPEGPIVGLSTNGLSWFLLAWASGLYLELDGLLGLVRVLRALVDLQLGHLLPAQAIARHHAADRLDEDAVGVGLHPVARPRLLQAAGVARVPVVGLGLELLAGEADLLRVD